MATLSPAGRITAPVVEAELKRLAAAWSGQRDAGHTGAGAGETSDPDGPGDLCTEVLGVAGAAGLDRFDRVQLTDVLGVCRASRSLSEAGRELFAASRERRSSVNDADRLRKYLARFGLTWELVNRP